MSEPAAARMREMGGFLICKWGDGSEKRGRGRDVRPTSGQNFGLASIKQDVLF